MFTRRDARLLLVGVAGLAWLVAATAAGCSTKRARNVAGAGGTGAADMPGTGGGGGAVGASPAFPLKLVAGQHYLADQNDQPFLMIGESPWNIALSITTDQATTYLENRRQKGFTAVLVIMLDTTATKNANGDSAFTATLPGTSTPDFSTPDELYFAHIDEIVGIAAQKGLLVELIPAYLGYQGGTQGWYQQMKANGVTKLASYGTYLGNRYKGFGNIIWVDGGDTDPTVTDVNGAKIDPLYSRTVANAIKAADPAHLHTVHGNAGNSPLDAWPGETWLDVSTVYTYPLVVDRVPVYMKALAEYAHAGSKPFFLIESTYEGDTTYNPSAQTIRQQAYEALLGGAMGENFGNGVIWPFATGWQAAMESRGSQDMSHLAALFAARHAERLVPDAAHAFVTGGFGAGASYVSAALASDGKVGLAYVPTASGAVTVSLAKMSSGGSQVSARWFDPTSGAFTAVPGSPFPSSGNQSFTLPGANGTGDSDWVLVLEAT